MCEGLAEVAPYLSLKPSNGVEGIVGEREPDGRAKTALALLRLAPSLSRFSMAYDWLKGVADEYDVIVIGSGLGGLTGANVLAKAGHRVLLLEHHYQFGGLATWFTRKGGHIFDISLHGFPSGMLKSCRKYWTKEIADSIVQLKDIRFVNPQMDVWTTFTREDYTRVLVEQFKLPREQVEAFYDHLRAMNYYDNNPETTGEMLARFFPGREDVHRLLMEPISYANGSNFDDPAITFGIVFSNFMGAGVYTFRGGSDLLIEKMTDELKKNGVELRKKVLVDKILVEERDGRKVACGIVAGNGRVIRAKAVLSNANIKNTIFRLAGEENFPADFVEQAKAVRINTSSCQVYLGIRKGETIPHIGDLVFTSAAPKYSNEELTDLHTTSRTFSVYYPDTRPGSDRYTVVASLNGRYPEWKALSDEEYEKHKERLIEESIVALENFIPGVREKIDWKEAATPRTIERYTTHMSGTSFGTKFEGLPVSMSLSEKLPGLYHAGSVGIIMSGWLGTINYGVITANKIDQYVRAQKRANDSADSGAIKAANV
jgi:all-trans-retinol 13,14-reductase